MTLAERIAEQVAKLPALMKELLDQQLVAGNQLRDVEIGRGKQAGNVAIMLDHPFRYSPAELPSGLQYRELKDRDPMIFEYYTTDEKWSLFTAKFKPMVLQPLPAPPDRMQEHLDRMKEVRARDEAAAKHREELAREIPRQNAGLTDPVNKFLASMTMTFEMWHDGNGYDLQALAQVPSDRLSEVETVLLNHRPVDWRDIEALARINSPAANAAVIAALNHAEPKVRQEAQRHVPAEAVDPSDREKHLLKALQSDDVFGGLSDAIDEAEEFHPPAVVDFLMHGALNRTGPTAILFAGLLYFIHGKSDSAFDWNHRPFFLRFDTGDRAHRKTAFRELCQTIGVDPAKYGC